MGLESLKRSWWSGFYPWRWQRALQPCESLLPLPAWALTLEGSATKTKWHLKGSHPKGTSSSDRKRRHFPCKSEQDCPSWAGPFHCGKHERRRRRYRIRTGTCHCQWQDCQGREGLRGSQGHCSLCSEHSTSCSVPQHPNPALKIQ